MSRRIRLKQSHFRSDDPDTPTIKPISQWPKANEGFYYDFRAWLSEAGYSESALLLYSVAARLALGLLDKPYWMIELEVDFQQVEVYLAEVYDDPGTRTGYLKGLRKLGEFLRLRNRQPAVAKAINWDTYFGPLPAWLPPLIREFITHRRRFWNPEQQHKNTIGVLCHLTLCLRWLATQTTLTGPADITPQWWLAYLDHRLEQGRKPTTVNIELSHLLQFLRFLQEAGHPVCERMLRVAPIKENAPLPKDVPPDRLRQVWAAIEADATADHTHTQRLGRMDKAWFLLMLHSGLRTGEARRLRRGDLDMQRKLVRLEQAKGLKDRLVPLSQPAVDALSGYLAQRGPANTNHVFLYRHQPLSVSYCAQRLRTYGRRCGVTLTPHQLRHSCATLLLNAGVPVLTVQTILGHKHIDTTLGYARLYDGTVATDYYRAMGQVEQQLALGEDILPEPTTPAHLLAMVDALQSGTLNDHQRETVQQLRDGILAMSQPDQLSESGS